MTDREKFQAAYKAWREATDAHDAKMRAVLAGELVIDFPQLLAECGELTRLLEAFTEASKPFAHWR